MGKPKLQLEEKKFGRLTAIECVGSNKYGCTMWKCLCDCGNEKIARGSSLVNGQTVSCGCLAKERILEINKSRKGISIYNDMNKRIIDIFYNMKDRCYNSTGYHYKCYGNRGITICEEWLDKENGIMNFYNWSIENGYSDNLTIDRIDVDGNYEPNNCRWITMKEQASNRRTNVYITIHDETHTISEWAEIIGISPATFSNRVKKNYTDDMLLSEPKHTGARVKKLKLMNEALKK